ncbi:hypothetical protein DUI87_03448 [Hirundo rustica rustica]|uniref:Reverse transcriptase domain-containing protein n=1 Tax=Hirundo rustica rustica TaxID=333673 RepID=A0A3M0L2T0_HIRRU|nr:hypothetical protein DUI87_03448 [Hirundo rustica rustica]
MKRDETEETVLDMAKKLQAYADAVHGPTHARIAALETHMRKLEDKIEENHKELREDILQISAVQVRGSGTTRKRSLDREGKGIPWAKLWVLLRECGENMKRWDGESTDAMTQRLHELLDGKTTRGSSSKKEAAPVTREIRVVSKTHSPFNSPIWPVHKSDGEWRLTVDYCALNEVTPPLSTAVPDMLELQYELESKTAKWYATIDIANTFFSIPLSVECRPQFAFTWRGVQYTWD